ncbi:MAG: hypothetical protein CSA65_01480 [Proteobacteria bacterium]|nr:MAG: hypothetical protein CSB49_03150 [Pseudomonadota bacterium]PIE19682.1 MAG: hypothetical protein CSA65_01480 [Pseudomonadota bacterium]
MLTLVALPACGPIQYISTVTFKARRLVSEAKTAEAKSYAPYEYWSAVTYLRMAREKAGYADFQNAADYGDRAVAMARKARELSDERRRAGPSAKPATAAEAPAKPVQTKLAPDGKDDEQPPPAVKVVPSGKKAK